MTSTNDQPLDGGAVRLTRLGLNAYTDANGHYRLAISRSLLSKRDTITVQAVRIGYQMVRQLITVSPGDSLELDASLCQVAVQLEEVVTTSLTARVPGSITNVQHEGVDEGDIVKLAGDYLVVLRRGRLFTVGLGGNDLTPTSASDAFGPGIDPSGTWYDEMLIDQSRVVVIGYSYARGGTEIGVFDLDARGGLHHRGTYQLRSNDYYSARNYASRLIGGRLVFYTPLYLGMRGGDPLTALPAMRQWHEGADGHNGEFRRIATASRVYQPAMELSAGDVALHTVTVCDLRRAELSCDATVVVGPSARVFYMSPRAVYVWASPWRNRPTGATSIVYRMPLDGSAPSALRAEGTPIDQFSFLESDDGFLNVLVHSDGRGDAMWAVEHGGGQLALLRVPLGRFGDGSTAAARSTYRPLPAPQGRSLENRFVGDVVLYGAGNGWDDPASESSTLFAAQSSTGTVTELALSHPIDRIEPMGSGAVVIGADRHDLHFSGVATAGPLALRQEWTMPNAAQGELRSHGFFYRSDDDDRGVLGLPVREGGKPGYSHLMNGSAAVVFLRNGDGRFSPLGELASLPRNPADDKCRASCVDWYGNARPLFIQGRIFALLGYELVEGRLTPSAISEVRRVDIATSRR